MEVNRFVKMSTENLWLHINERHIHNEDKMVAVKLPKNVNTFCVETTIKGEWDYDAYHLTCFQRPYLSSGYKEVDFETFKNLYPKAIRERLEPIEKEIYRVD